MTIMSESHALKQVCRQLRKKGEPIGSPERPFMSEFFMGRAPGRDEVNHLRSGVERGAERGLLYVKRDELGTIVLVDEFDCAKTEEPKAEVLVPTKPALSAIEVFPLLCKMLKDYCAADGRIMTGRNLSALISELHRELSKQYEVSVADVRGAFDALLHLGLRDNAKRLRRSGLWFDDVEAARITVTDNPGVAEGVPSEHVHRERVASQQREIERLKKTLKAQEARIKLQVREISGLLEENQALTDENALRAQGEAASMQAAERLEQANADLRRRNEALSQFERAVRVASEDFDENR